jgi:hypothetical protein
MSHRDNRAFLATPWCQSLKAGPKNRVALTGKCRHSERTTNHPRQPVYGFGTVCVGGNSITWTQARQLAICSRVGKESRSGALVLVQAG